MSASLVELRAKGGQIATEMLAWLEHEQLARQLLAWRAGTTAQLASDPQLLAAVRQSALLAMANFFLVRSTLQFRKKYLWFFRRPDWEALGAVWEGFTEVLAAQLSAEQRETLETMEILWGPATVSSSPPDVAIAEHLARALDPEQSEKAKPVAKKFLPLLERQVNKLADEIFGP